MTINTNSYGVFNFDKIYKSVSLFKLIINYIPQMIRKINPQLNYILIFSSLCVIRIYLY